MLVHYHLLNMCLAELAKLRHYGLLKIRLEIEIIQLKRLLLNEGVAASLVNNPDSEGWFVALFDGFLGLGEALEPGQAIEELIEFVTVVRSRVECEAGGTVDLAGSFPAADETCLGRGKDNR